MALLCAASLFAAKKRSEQPAKPTTVAEYQAVIDRLDSDIKESTLKINSLTWERYMSICTESNKSAEIFSYKGFDAKKLYDTVPDIAGAYAAYRKASDNYWTVVRTDPEYPSIHAEYGQIKKEPQGDERKKMETANQQRYQDMYKRLRADNPEYAPAYDAYQKAQVERNNAIIRFLLDYLHGKGEPLPTDGIIPSDVARQINSDPEISNLRLVSYDLLSIKSTARRQMYEMKYGVSQNSAPLR